MADVPVTEEQLGKGEKRELRLTCWQCGESDTLIGHEQIKAGYIAWYRSHRQCREQWRRESAAK